MSYGPYAVFPTSIPSGATRSAEINLGRAWKNLYLEVPTFPSQSTLYLLVAANSGDTFRRIVAVAGNTASIQATEFAVVSYCSNLIIKLDSLKFDSAQYTGGVVSTFRFVKVESQNAISNGQSFNFIASD